MKHFLSGVLVTVLVAAFGIFLYLKMGYLDMRADIAPSSFESQWAMRFLDASVDRRAPEGNSPVEASEATLIEGIRLYKTNCAVCHGAPGHPEKTFGHPFYPPAPQFTEEATDMPESENYYIIKHGIRWTGMPAWGSVLSDQQIWTLTTFLSHMEKLPQPAAQEWQKPPASPPGVMSGMPGHGGPKVTARGEDFQKRRLNMSRNRRDFFRRALLGAGALAGANAWAGQQGQNMPPDMEMQHMHMKMPHENKIQPTSPKGETGGPFHPVDTPDLGKLPYTLDNGVKVFHLIAEPVKRPFIPGYTFNVWGYSGSCPGPMIEVIEGDRVQLVVENHLPEATAIHWHGLEVPFKMDGVPGICQDPIPPGGRYVYEFTLHQNGTFFYHSHMAMQEMMGMIGFFIIHPRQPYAPKVDKDFGLILQEWAILPNNTIPNTMSMEFNWLTLNGRSGPDTTPLIVRLGDRVRIRMVNLGMDHHPMHLHGNTFYVTGTEGGRAPESTWRPENTVLVGVAQARDVEFEAKYPGDWMLHCHLPHHMMNQMVSMVGPMMEAGHGMQTGMGMEEGMGMLRQGSATSEESGPSLGRAIGIGADHEKPTTNMPLSAPAMQGMPGMTHEMQHMGHTVPGMQMEGQNPQSVPGYPQDMFMPMDEIVARPETFGLRKGWSGGMMGMMTLVRVLPPELYDKTMELKKR